jgi:hypothetical protein
MVGRSLGRPDRGHGFAQVGGGVLALRAVQDRVVGEERRVGVGIPAGREGISPPDQVQDVEPVDG